jgi:hypothetical protein
MNSHILSKFAIIAATFVINGLMFDGQMHQRTDWFSLTQADGAGKTADHAVALGASRRRIT